MALNLSAFQIMRLISLVSDAIVTDKELAEKNSAHLDSLSQEELSDLNPSDLLYSANLLRDVEFLAELKSVLLGGLKNDS